MYYLSKALVFIACLLTAVAVNWWTGVIALIVAAIYLRELPIRTVHSHPKGLK